ncbi:hypothetical protein Cob_v003279 [Colletotrichum orbiculare MAFF 240422]|uniref:CCHC-type domain-containing protein n=1 Tax=Colletotrichum orbiculare (strain 104-T / ATCC 96160 / CBS 514.97 / LARS 414 / MAFF 240422) TaxID=1213857 RepID=N4VXI2_COLOR|nr:hypothetical protein Cob_v003279 [Colletotrichum orbiculare MAFF 240422]
MRSPGPELYHVAGKNLRFRKQYVNRQALAEYRESLKVSYPTDARLTFGFLILSFASRKEAGQFCSQRVTLSGRNGYLEPIDIRGVPIFCICCSRSGHVYSECHSDHPICGRCSKSHYSTDCDLDDEKGKLTCPNCLAYRTRMRRKDPNFHVDLSHEAWTDLCHDPTTVTAKANWKAWRATPVPWSIGIRNGSPDTELASDKASAVKAVADIAKRGRGRPVGSKDKPKMGKGASSAAQAAQSAAAAPNPAAAAFKPAAATKPTVELTHTAAVFGDEIPSAEVEDADATMEYEATESTAAVSDGQIQREEVQVTSMSTSDGPAESASGDKTQTGQDGDAEMSPASEALSPGEDIGSRMPGSGGHDAVMPTESEDAKLAPVMDGQSDKVQEHKEDVTQSAAVPSQQREQIGCAGVQDLGVSTVARSSEAEAADDMRGELWGAAGAIIPIRTAFVEEKPKEAPSGQGQDTKPSGAEATRSEPVAGERPHEMPQDSPSVAVSAAGTPKPAPVPAEHASEIGGEGSHDAEVTSTVSFQEPRPLAVVVSTRYEQSNVAAQGVPGEKRPWKDDGKTKHVHSKRQRKGNAPYGTQSGLFDHDKKVACGDEHQPSKHQGKDDAPDGPLPFSFPFSFQPESACGDERPPRKHHGKDDAPDGYPPGPFVMGMKSVCGDEDQPPRRIRNRKLGGNNVKPGGNQKRQQPKPQSNTLHSHFRLSQPPPMPADGQLNAEGDKES